MDTRTPISRRSIKLRTAMLAKRLTFDRLALQIGVERTRLNRISNEVITPKPDEAKRIAEAVGLDVPDLFREDKE
jgi:transcriptional regulator with XRE-family HTH domain